MDNRGSTFKRRIEYAVTKEKIDQAMRWIAYNRHVRETKSETSKGHKTRYVRKRDPFQRKGMKME